MSDSEPSLEVYAAVVAAIAAGSSRFAAVLAQGLDEDAFDALEAAVEARLSSALDVEGDNVDPFLQRYEAAMRKAQLAARPASKASIDDIARAVVALERGTDPRGLFEHAGMSAADLASALAALGAKVGGSDELYAALEAHRAGKRHAP